MIKEKEIIENNYSYYLIYRELGYRSVDVIGFKHLPEMIQFITEHEAKIVILERLVTFK